MGLPLIVVLVLLGFVILVARVEANSDKHAPWRIAVLGARRTFPLKWQAATLVVVLTALALATAVAWYRGALPGLALAVGLILLASQVLTAADGPSS